VVHVLRPCDSASDASRGYLQAATAVQGDGTFTQPITWPATAIDDVPPSIATAGSHTIVARQIVLGLLKLSCL
jgi:hypothetical protein